jgi:hypothetical protein
MLKLTRFPGRVPPLHGVAATGIKGRGSLAAEALRLKPDRDTPPPRAFPYPQNLWTSLWTHGSGMHRFRRQIAFLLPWSKNDHAVLSSFINEL